MVEKTLQINTCKQISGLKSMDAVLLEVCTTFTQAAAGRASKVHKPLLLASLDHRTEPERELSDCPVASTAFWPSSEGSGSLLANLNVSCLLLRDGIAQPWKEMSPQSVCLGLLLKAVLGKEIEVGDIKPLS